MTLSAGFGDMAPPPFNEQVYQCLEYLMQREFGDHPDLLWRTNRNGFRVINIRTLYGFHSYMDIVPPLSFKWVLFSAERNDPFSLDNLVDLMGPFWGTLGKEQHWPTYTLGHMGRIYPLSDNPEVVKVFGRGAYRKSPDEVAIALLNQFKECGIALLAGNRAIMSQCDACPRQLACAAIQLPRFT